jgi:hypothetical protein
LEVTDESPEELVFAMPMLTYTGRVSHAFTNEPMAGVFVIAMNSSSKGNLSMITDQEWEALHALDSNPSIHDPALKPVDKIYGFENIVRTGEDGRFEMLCPKGDTPYGFVFFEQNYIGLKHSNRMKTGRWKSRPRQCTRRPRCSFRRIRMTNAYRFAPNGGSTKTKTPDGLLSF